jgi:hypothetical protein
MLQTGILNLPVEFKAAQLEGNYLKALKWNCEVVSRPVTGNLFDRYMKLLFL